MSKSYLPINDNIIVKRVKAAEQIGSIAVPSSVVKETKNMRGTVIAVGDGVALPNSSFRQVKVKVGEIVWFRRYSGCELSEDFMPGEDCVCILESDVLFKEVEA